MLFCCPFSFRVDSDAGVLLCVSRRGIVVADMDRRTGVIGAGLASSAFFFKESVVVLSFFLSLVRCLVSA